MKFTIPTLLALLLSLSTYAQENATDQPALVATPEAKAPPPVEVKANVAASAIFNTGNSESKTFGGNGMISRKWGKNKVEGTAIGAYGRATTTDKTTLIETSATNTKNWETTGRYDRYLLDPLSVFDLAHIGQNQPAGYDLRYGNAVGLAHELWKVDPDFFKYEVGFDVTYEDHVVPPNSTIYSARLFLQYKRKFSTYAVFGQDVESLFNVVHGNDVRLNTLTSITAKLTGKVGFQVGYAVRWDHVPVPGFKKLDTTTQMGLVVTFM